jgi:hypothetical protein
MWFLAFFCFVLIFFVSSRLSFYPARPPGMHIFIRFFLSIPGFCDEITCQQ